jgi:uncharacterized protein with HEPN domain
MKKDDSVYLKHIIDAISRIQDYTKGVKYKDFIKNHLLQDGVIRQLEIIGEATKKLSNDTRQKNPEIPWKDMAGFRDKLIHDYFGVDLDAVWEAVERDIPTLKGKLTPLIGKETAHT